MEGRIKTQGMEWDAFEYKNYLVWRRGERKKLKLAYRRRERRIMKNQLKPIPASDAKAKGMATECRR